MTINDFAKTTKQYTYTWDMGHTNDGTIVTGTIAKGTNSGKLTWSDDVASYSAVASTFSWSVACTLYSGDYQVVYGGSPNYRYKFGQNSNLFGTLTFSTTTPYYYTVKSVALWANSSMADNAHLTVTVGGNTYVDNVTIAKETKSPDNRPIGVEYVGTGTSTGAVVINISLSKPLYINKIVITYEI